MPGIALLSTSPSRFATLQPEIADWTARRQARGWQVSVRQTAVTSGYDDRAQLAALPPFSHLFEVGSLPQIYGFLGPDSHYLRWLPLPSHKLNRDVGIDNAREPGTDHCNLPIVMGAPYASYGRITFDGMTSDGLTKLTEEQITDQYRRWFARQKYVDENGCADSPAKIELLDHFNFVTDQGVSFKDFGDATAAQFAEFPKSFRRFTPPPINDDDDGEMVKQEPALFYFVYSGGIGEGDGEHLFYWGGYPKLVLHPMQAPRVGFFGSYMCETENMDSEVRCGLLDLPGPGSKSCKAIASVYSHRGDFCWQVFLDGGTLGEANTQTWAAIGMGLDTLHGDPTDIFDTASRQRLVANEQGTGDQVTEAQFNAAVADMTMKYQVLEVTVAARLDDLTAKNTALVNRVTTLESGGSTTTVPPPPPGSNYCLDKNGGRASASSFFLRDPGYMPANAINGNTHGKWSERDGWNQDDATPLSAASPQWLQVDFAHPQSVNKIKYFSVQDLPGSPVVPTPNLKFHTFGMVDFTLEVLVGTAWQLAATVTGNDLVECVRTFPTVANVIAVRATGTKAADAVNPQMRCMEIEAYGP